jgi:hypothetical protein
MENIENVLNSEKSTLDLNEDTETMNNQLAKHMDKVNKKKNTATTGQRIITIDKEQLRTLIVEWLSLDDIIKAHREVIKDKIEEKKQYEEQILELMTALEQETIMTEKGNLKRNVKASKSSLTPELIKITLTDILKCASTADVYTNSIMDKRTTKEIVSLKRNEFENKKGKKKNIFNK